MRHVQMAYDEQAMTVQGDCKSYRGSASFADVKA